MSVVNEVLRDLSQRQPEAYAHLRTETPAAIASNRHGLLLLLMALILLALLLLYWWHSQTVDAAKATTATVIDQPFPIANATTLSDHQPEIELPAAGRQQYMIEQPITETVPETLADVTEAKPTKIVAVEVKNEALPASKPLAANAPAAKTKLETEPPAATSSAQPIDIKPTVLSIAEQQQSLLQSAQLVLSRGDVVAAEKWLAEAHQLDPGEASIRNSWLKTLMVIDASRAEAQLQLLLQRFPEDWQLRELLASLWIRQQRFDDALNTLRAATPPMANAASYYALMALALQQTEQHPEALSLYRTLLQLQPQHGAHYAGAAISAERTGEISFANQAYGRALADPQLPAPVRAYAEQRRRQLLQATP